MDNRNLFMGKRKMICALTALLVLVSGCNNAEDTVATSAAYTSSETKTIYIDTSAVVPLFSEETTAVYEKEPEEFVFNPHVKCSLLSEAVEDGWWDDLHNMIDAIRAGEDTFECGSEESFLWCTDEVTMGNYYPPACTLVEGGGFENGTGKLKYLMPEYEFACRKQEFEDEICRIINEAVRSDYSDFEKLTGLYVYVCDNFSYDYDPIDGQGIDGFGDYACIMTKNGICCEIAGAFSYLLMQCGIDATIYSGGGTGGHTWTYAVINGTGYHVDATWGLKSEYGIPGVYLTYFMETDNERIADGFERETFEPDLISYRRSYYDISRFEVTDDSFEPLHQWTVFVSMDAEKNVIRYKNMYDEVLEFDYSAFE